MSEIKIAKASTFVNGGYIGTVQDLTVPVLCTTTQMVRMSMSAEQASKAFKNHPCECAAIVSAEMYRNMERFFEGLELKSPSIKSERPLYVNENTEDKRGQGNEICISSG
jgi:hypothetical protein